jgi:hypothetical protein
MCLPLLAFLLVFAAVRWLVAEREKQILVALLADTLGVS